jgi:hypothetical protein
VKLFAIQKYKNNPNIIILGDFNSQVGMSLHGEWKFIGNYGYGKRNERGWRLLNFCQENNLKIVNTFYKKRMSRRWTWISPNYNTTNLIDYTYFGSNKLQKDN